jgi:hypothetical protein
MSASSCECQWKAASAIAKCTIADASRAIAGGTPRLTANQITEATMLAHAISPNATLRDRAVATRIAAAMDSFASSSGKNVPESRRCRFGGGLEVRFEQGN